MNLLFARGFKSEVFDALLQNLDAQLSAKFVCNAVATLLDLLKNWGLRNLESLQPFFPKIEKLTMAGSMQIRSATMDFYVEAYKWMGESLKMRLSNVRAVQVKELTKIFNELAPKMQVMVPK